MTQRRLQKSLHICMILMMISGLMGALPVRAEAEPSDVLQSSAAEPTPPGPELRYGYAEDGRVNFIGGSSGSPLLSGAEGVSAMSDVDAAEAVLAQYGPEFGLQDPLQELKLDRSAQDEQGSTLRYRQEFAGIPVLGGEMLVNRDEYGNILSLNGEVSPGLAPAVSSAVVSAEQAQQKAAAGAQEWYGLAAENVGMTPPELWWYDERIFKPGNKPVTLTWRMELTALDGSQLVRELVLVDAVSGEIVLHFNQIDTSWHNQAEPPAGTETPVGEPTAEPTVEATLEPTLEPVVTETPLEQPTSTAEPPAEEPVSGQAGVVWYVSPTGNDANGCASVEAPCASINGALTKATSGDVIRVAVGTYTGTGSEVARILKNMELSGGWNNDFTAQVGHSTIDGQNTRRGFHICSGDCSINSTGNIIVKITNFQFIHGIGGGSAVVASRGVDLTLDNSVARHNTGVTIASYRGKLSITNTTVSHNTIQDGAAINIEEDSLVYLSNLTVAYNRSQGLNYTRAAGVNYRLSPASGQLILQNSIIANNTSNSNPADIYGQNIQIVSAGYNLIGSLNGVDYVAAVGDIVGQNPGLANLPDLMYVPLAPYSPAIDAGSPELPGSGGTACGAFDQYSTARPVDGDGDGVARCDMGAYETQIPDPAVPKQITLVSGDQQIAGYGAAFEPMSVRVIDQYNLLLAGAQVTFTAPASGASGQFDGNESFNATVLTNSEGIAEAPVFRANDVSGIYSVTAAAAGSPDNVVFSLENYHSYPVTAEVLSGQGQYSGRNRKFSIPLKIRVLDAKNQPVKNVEVNFAAPTEGATGLFVENLYSNTTELTDVDGIADATLMANGVLGRFEVHAAVNATNQEFVFPLEILDLYVSQTGHNNFGAISNDCRNALSPCQTLNHAMAKAFPGVTIYMVGGEVAYPTFGIDKNAVLVSGGWNETFTSQDTNSIVYAGQNNNGISNNSQEVEIDRVSVIDGSLGILNNGTMILSRSAIIGNSVGFNNNGSAEVINTIVNGTASAFQNNGPLLIIKNSNVVNNHGPSALVNSTSDGVIILQNSVFSQNDHRNCWVTAGRVISAGHNIFDTETPCPGSRISQYIAHPTDLVGVDPQRGISNPVIDAIDLDEPDSFCPATDFHGVSRPQTGFCDIGAFEYSAGDTFSVLKVLEGEYQSTFPTWEFIAPVKVQLTDEFGHLLSGADVTFEGPEQGASVIFAESGTTQVVQKTDDTGVAVAQSFHANEFRGNYQIRIAANDVILPRLLQISNEGRNRYVNPEGGNDGVNDSNDCLSPSNPCLTLKQAVLKSNPGELIKLSVSSQDGDVNKRIVSVDHPLIISGGWDRTYTNQVGQTTTFYSVKILDGVKAIMDRMGVFFVSVDGNLDIRKSQISSTYSRYYNVYNSGHMVISDCLISGADEGVKNYGHLEIYRSTLTKNRTALNNYNYLIMENSVISHNNHFGINFFGVASGSAGIMNLGGTAILTHVTIVFNNHYGYENLPQSSGIFNQSGSVRLSNSIVAGNRASSGFDCRGNITSLGHNLIGIVDGCDFQRANGDIIGTQENPIAPALSNITNFNETLTIGLTEFSPAIDAADQATCLSVDQRGITRPIGVGCDIGAFEGVNPESVAINQVVFQAKYKSYVPDGTLLCASPASSCTGGENRDADDAYHFTEGALRLYYDQHGRYGIYNSEAAVLSSVNSDQQQGNASWTGVQVLYGDGFPHADDVVAHELTHGVTQNESNLFYYYQSGAINESFSDLWGEYYDQTNGEGNDLSAVKWIIGEDLSEGGFRSMNNPPAFQDPDRMTSSYYYRGDWDNGGVHTNSGVNNKAVSLMVVGGAFNGKTVRALGWKKTAAIYYYVQTHLLTSGSDFADLYHALQQSCAVLKDGPQGVTDVDCASVKTALDAVQMNSAPYSTFNPDAAVCPSGTTLNSNPYFFDDFENGDSLWEYGVLSGSNRWSIAPGTIDLQYATSGKYALFGNDYDRKRLERDQISDTYARILDEIYIPKGDMAFLRFNHAFGFETLLYAGRNYFFDGALVEYSVNHGETWLDARPLFNSGQTYNHIIYNSNSDQANPLRGRLAFTGDSHGYVSTRLNLNSLAGKSVSFRWRIGTDYTGSNLGWAIDDVMIYGCAKPVGSISLKLPVHNSLTQTYLPRLDWSDSANVQRYELQVATDIGLNSMIIHEDQLVASEYILLSELVPDTRYYWRVRAFNNANVSGVWSKIYSFRTPMIPPVPNLPLGGAVLKDLRPAFEWTGSPGATSYTLIISPYANFSSTLLKVTVPNPTYQPTKDLPAGKILYWRVMANGANPSAWSAGGQFVTPRPPSVPVLLLPGNNALLAGYTTTLQWKASVIPTGAAFLANYQLQLDDNGDFSSPLIDRNDLTATSLDLADALADNQKYFWRVRSINTNGDMSAWSTVYTLRTPLITPVPESPANASAVNVLRPTFAWTVSPGASSYNLMVSAYPNLASPILNVSVPTTSYLPTKDLPSGKILYWRVRAVGANPSLWSATYSLSTPRPPSVPGLAAPQNNALLTNQRPSLVWKPSTVPAGAATLSGYELQVDDTADFTSPLVSETGLSETVYSFATDLADNTRYGWRVRACNMNGDCSSWGVFTFRTSLLPPVAESPMVDEGLSDPTPLFNWGDVNGAVSYSLAVSTSSSFSGTLISTTVTTSQYQSLRSLPLGRTIYWRVRANGPNGPSLWSDLRSFQVE